MINHALKLKCYRHENFMAIVAQYIDGSSRQIALFELPNDGDWRGDVEFYDGLVDIYKKRFRRI